MSVVTINPQMAGRTFRTGVDETWANIRANAGTFSASDDGNPGIRVVASTTLNQWNTNGRPIIVLPVTSIPAGSIIDTSVPATLQIFSNVSGSTLGNLDTVLSTSLPASDSTIANGDYNTVGTTAYSSLLNTGSMLANAYNTWTLNAAAMTALQALIGGTTPFRLSVQTNNDLTNSAPTWVVSANTTVDMFFTNATHPIILTVTLKPTGGFTPTLLTLGIA